MDENKTFYTGDETTNEGAETTFTNPAAEQASQYGAGGRLVYGNDEVSQAQTSDDSYQNIPESVFGNDDYEETIQEMTVGSKTAKMGFTYGLIAICLQLCGGLVTCLCCLLALPMEIAIPVLAILGIVYSAKGIRLTKETGTDGKAVAGLVLSIITLVLFLFEIFINFMAILSNLISSTISISSSSSGDWAFMIQEIMHALF